MSDRQAPTDAALRERDRIMQSIAARLLKDDITDQGADFVNGTAGFAFTSVYGGRFEVTVKEVASLNGRGLRRI